MEYNLPSLCRHSDFTSSFSNLTPILEKQLLNSDICSTSDSILFITTIPGLILGPHEKQDFS